MLRLNDDCLSLIFNNLNLRQQLRLTAVCERFRDIIVSVQWRSRFCRFETSGNSEIDRLSHYEFLSLFKLIGHRIEHFVISEKVDRRIYTWRPEPTYYLRLKFPVLRVLEVHINVDEVDMLQLAAHCPLIEELHLTSKTWLNPEDIVDMHHLRKLYAPKSFIMRAKDLQQILTTLQLTALCFRRMWMVYPISISEVVLGASDLQVLKMSFDSDTEVIMECMIDLASTTDRRQPLTVYIFKEKDDSNKYDKYVEIDEDDESDDNYFRDDEIDNYYMFEDYKCSLQPLINNALTSPAHVLVEPNSLEFRFFSQSNKN